MKKNRILSTLCVIATVMAILCGCGKKSSLNCPFTEMDWSSSIDEIESAEGELVNSYPSQYEGTTYLYEKEYIGRNGTVKYMTDKDGALMDVAWTYSSDDDSEVITVFKELDEYLTSEYGDSTNEGKNINNYNKIWTRKEGNIVLTTVITSDLKAVQVVYKNPVVSNGNSQNPDTK